MDLKNRIWILNLFCNYFGKLYLNRISKRGHHYAIRICIENGCEDRRLWKRAIDVGIFPEFAVFNSLRLMILTWEEEIPKNSPSSLSFPVISHNLKAKDYDYCVPVTLTSVFQIIQKNGFSKFEMQTFFFPNVFGKWKFIKT